jgi:hypothetical protein
MPKFRIVELTEFAALKEGEDRVVKNDDGSVLVKGVKLLGTESSNLNEDGTRNRYQAKHMPEWAPRYEGAPIFADHSLSDGTRSVRDKIGRVQNVEARESGLYGDTLYAPGKVADKVAWAAKSAPDFYSMSHHASGLGLRESEDSPWTDIEKIETVYSVDLVVAGGTTNSLYEHKAQEAPVADETQAPEAADVVEAEAVEAPADNAELLEAQAKVEALEAENARLKREAGRKALLAESKIPADKLSDVFVESVLSADSDEKAAALIEDRRKVVFHQEPVSGAPEISVEVQEDRHSTENFLNWIG